MVNSDLNYIKVEDVSEEKPKVLFDTNMTLTPNYKFPNSFLSCRYPPTEFQANMCFVALKGCGDSGQKSN